MTQTTPSRKQLAQELRRVATGLFAAHPSLQSITLCVAQHFSDEAHDAVHAMLFASELAHFDFTAAAKAQYVRPDTTNLPTLTPLHSFQGCEPERWPRNTEAIPAFAAFCIEDTNQWMGIEDSFRPCLTFFRDGTESYAPMLRPWLDGVRPVAVSL